ncbi:MAG: hypothetical protein AB1Z98_22965 [Nannocystaceae bacterium]
MPSKMVIQRLRSSRIVVQAARVHGPTVTAALEARLPPGDAGASAVGPLCVSLASVLEAAAERMDRADADHEREQADDASPRSERDASSEALLSALVDLRGAVSLTHGDAAVATLGFTGPTPRDPTELATLGTRVLERVAELPPQPSRLPGLTLDLEPLTAAISSPLSTLQAALQQVATESREGEQTLVAKQAAMTDYDATFRAVATTLQGLFSLAGATELAARVRPSSRRPGQVDAEPTADEAPPPPAAPTPEADEPAAT